MIYHQIVTTSTLKRSLMVSNTY